MITEQQLFDFVNTLEVKLREVNDQIDVQLQRSPSGHYIITAWLNGEANSYSVNLVTEDWMRYYGPL
jgi:predicted aspartyl protease